METVFQESSADCGLACLATIASHFGHHISVNRLRSQFWPSHEPLSVADILRIAGRLGLACRALRLDIEEISELRLPCILHWRLNHFVVLERIQSDSWLIIDPAQGKRRVTRHEASQCFTGIAVESQPSSLFKPCKPQPLLSLFELAKGFKSNTITLAYIILLVVALEAISLTSPLVSQWVIDGALASRDRDFLLVAVVGGALLVTFKFILTVASDVARLMLGQRIGLQWSANLFAHLLALPWMYFQNRPLGEISSRFSTLKPIKDWLLTVLTLTAVDLLMVIGALSLMALYSPTLMFVVVFACASYALVQLVFYPYLRDATRERLVLSAREHAYFLESIRSVVTLKMIGNLSGRVGQWINLQVDVQNRDTATQRLQILVSAANTLIFGLESMVILYIGGHQVIASTMTIGMLIAFIGFKGHFTARTGRLIDTFIQYRIQAVYCERLADVALHPSEDTGLQSSPLPHSPLRVELINVSFRTSEQAPWVLRHINLTVAAGESLIITGRSGSGKSTLAKLILGLLTPTEGQILISGIPIAEIGQAELRAAVGTILQEDQVLTGTLAENIAGFNLDAPFTDIEKAAQHANLHRVIIKLPMGYHTNISDNCSTLSSGQKQRLLLARAFYKKPRLLVLDEATSNLDLHTEQHVIQTIRQIKATKVTIAHRRETLAMAERVIHLERGMVIMDKSLSEK